MGQREKLLEHLRRNPGNVRFAELDRLLRWYGFECRQPRGGSSHYVYYRKGCPPLTVPRHRSLKAVYVKQALALVAACSGENEDEDYDRDE